MGDTPAPVSGQIKDLLVAFDDVVPESQLITGNPHDPASFPNHLYGQNDLCRRQRGSPVRSSTPKGGIRAHL